MKQRMARCKKDTSDWQQALQKLRSTPTKDLPSPAESLHGRPARTVNGQAPAKPINMQQIKQILEGKQEQYADQIIKCDTWYLYRSDLFAMYILTWWMLDSN